MTRVIFLLTLLASIRLLRAQGPLTNKPVFRSDSVPLTSQSLAAPLKLACPAGISIQHKGKRLEMTCPVCPDRSAFGAKSSWELKSAVFGHFVSATSDD